MNTAHSLSSNGLFVDLPEKFVTPTPGRPPYTPLANPLDPNSPGVTAVFDQFVSYKTGSTDGAVWIHGGNISVTNLKVSDNCVGITMAADGQTK